MQVLACRTEEAALREESAGLVADLRQLREARRLCQAVRREAAAAAAVPDAAAPAQGGFEQVPSKCIPG